VFDHEDTLKDLGAIDRDAPNPHTEVQQDLHSAALRLLHVSKRPRQPSF